MINHGDIKPEINPDDIARALAATHNSLSSALPSLSIYRQLPKISTWLDLVRTYCEYPDPAHSRAADWLLDNDYQILRAIRQVGSDLPENFFNRLPVTADKHDGGTPRIFEIARSLLGETRLQLSLQNIVRYLIIYQKVTTLSTAELWALPSMLRLACLEVLVVSFHQLNEDLKLPFELQGIAYEGQLSDPTDQIAKAIGNLAIIHAITWRDYFDQTSRVEAILKGDPARVYAQMDFDTRDRYRKVVEALSDGSNCTEEEIAEHAVAFASAEAGDLRRGHVGFWLIAEGRAQLEALAHYRPTIRERISRWALTYRRSQYALALILVVFAAFIIPVIHLSLSEASLLAWIIGISLSFLPATVLSISLVHWLITLLVSPKQLPALDFSKGIPHDCITAVVVPVIVFEPGEVHEIAERLEIRWLSNPSPRLRFVILSDFGDAEQETLPEDKIIEQELVLTIRNLNKRHGGAKSGPFYLMHRNRRYNPAQSCWMGWERKRGKIEQFNRFVLDGNADEFAICEGNLANLSKVRFVITLDADTMLPPNAGARLVGTLAHPLNTARFDPNSGEVIAGYTIIQPRIELLPSGDNETLFSHLRAGDTAIDIYTHAVSDVYQDLFGTGIYVGKGIYDVVAFHRAMEGRVPENAILSHDLFEGLFSRAALATNIVLYESFPSTYADHAMRLHRWIRGDWQLFPWLRRKVRKANGEFENNKLSILYRWEIIDNLRRSLIPLALLLFLICGWVVLPGNAWLWTLLAVAAPGIYLVSEVFVGLTRFWKRGYLGNLVHRLTERGGSWFLAITFLVSDTLISLDAVFRTLWRLSFSHRNLLEWHSAAHSASIAPWQGARIAAWRLMWPSSVISLLLAVELLLYDRPALAPAAPILFLWFIAPEIAVWTGKPRKIRREALDDEQSKFLIRVARRTWHYFETFAGPEDNWLPPDNFQEDPNGKVARRTSPTNIGFYLTSALVARDFGFIGTADFNSRAHHVLDSMRRMETFRGHILNWYDTGNLRPLEPRYISTVDSGNLAICLLALKQGSIETASKPVVDSKFWEGLACNLDILIEMVQELSKFDLNALRRHTKLFRDRFSAAARLPEQWQAIAQDLADNLWPEFELTINRAVAMSKPVPPRILKEIDVWLERFHHHLHVLLRDLDAYFPWQSLLMNPPPGHDRLADELLQFLTPTISMDAFQTTREGALKLFADAMAKSAAKSETLQWLTGLKAAIENGCARQKKLHLDLLELADQAHSTAFNMDFKFLYDRDVRLFRIGYNLSSGQLDTNHYDLLASEARLASFFAIAKHDIPLQHWFFLERPVTRLRGKPTVLSWNGSMFEYLMPPLFLPRKRDTLLGESESTAVEYQRRYARERGVPWGISESAFGVTDAEGNYQYRAFGAPGLGIRRGLTEDLVIAPYASALALCVWPNAAVQNLQRLRQMGAEGLYGFIDAMDFTPSRAPMSNGFTPVQTYMAHHQGMTIAAIANVLDEDILVRRVFCDKKLRTVELILQERIPWDAPIEEGHIGEDWEPHQQVAPLANLAPWSPSSASRIPQLHVIGNSRMAMCMSEAGGGGLSWQQTALTRWVPDATRDQFGYWIYVRDANTGKHWSLGRQPTGTIANDANTVFHQHMIEISRRDHDITARMVCTIAPNDDVEVRRITLFNEGDSERTIELTSYGEVVLAPPLEDERHPAFSKLFVNSSYLPEYDGLLFERRPRRPEVKPPVLLHKLVSDDRAIKISNYETDRKKFIGRNGAMSHPDGLETGLSGTTGWTLDPIMSLQVHIGLKPFETKEFAFVTIAGNSRNEVLECSMRYDMPSLEGVFRDALRHASRDVTRLGIEPSRLPQLQALSSLLLQPCATLRLPQSSVVASSHGQPALWRFGISGDLPILLLRMGDEKNSGLLEILVRAQQLWRRGGFHMDLAVLRTGPVSDEEPVRERILSILRDAHVYGFLGRRGGIHLLSVGQMDADIRHAVEAAAHVVLDAGSDDLNQMLDKVLERRAPPPHFEPAAPIEYVPTAPVKRPEGLMFDNGYGGFDAATGDYVIHLEPDQKTPSPWCNILANDTFGTIVSESGLGFTWAVNSGENRLTPWSNDPVADMPGEVVYLRDESTADVWSVTPAPLGQKTACQVRHAKGYTSWRQNSHALEQELCAMVPTDDPVKIVRLRLRNLTSSDRRITATYYAEWLLGALGSIAKPHIVCEYDAARHAILANNGWNPEFSTRIAFLSASRPPHSVSGDRYDFLGKEGSPENPAALRQWDLGGSFTSGGDSCAAYEVHLDIAAGETAEVVFVLGQGADRTETNALIDKWKNAERAGKALAEIEAFWGEKLGCVQVETPDIAFDLMINRWLPYQTFSSRMMARAGFYQAGGAFGYRDQLQDALALMHSDPNRVRRHILYAARHQFEQGDALHWWHPPSGRGVRTNCSDDYLWLAYVTARYVEATGDNTILQEEVAFLRGPELRPDQHDMYAQFEVGERATLFEHCARALDKSMVTGRHGLPLMGTGDWNDGMDRVGVKGEGESLWLAWFQISTIGLFTSVARDLKHKTRCERWRSHAIKLRAAIDKNGWDGEWFMRAFDDQGEAWGSHHGDECQIDSIAQSWSVLSGSTIDERTKTALASAAHRLISEPERLVKLLDPPFHETVRDPGYIKAYPPGVRENGGQYTHAAAWLGLAFAGLGDGDMAWRIFDIINPISRTTTKVDANLYAREPYVLSGDVSALSSNTGLGGWSWYTGSSSWTWQLGLQGILGIRLKKGAIQIDPCIPKNWGQAKITFQSPRGILTVTIENPENVGKGIAWVTVDGKRSKAKTIHFPGHNKMRNVFVRLGQKKGV